MSNITTFRDEVANIATCDLFASVPRRNSKMGNIPSFSTLPGNAFMILRDGRAVVDIVGTCGAHCDGCFGRYCYAEAYTRMYRETARAYARNTLLIRRGAFDRLKTQVTAHIDVENRPYFRWHVSGELETTGQFGAYCDVMESRPAVRFGIYTRALDIIECVYNERARVENLCINLSLENRLPFPDEVTRARRLGACFFIYDDGSNAELETLPHCPAVDKAGHKTGITCDKCGRCYTARSGSVMAVYAHGNRQGSGAE